MSIESLPIFIVDAFTSAKFSGNSAAICLVDHDQTIATDLMQRIATEMNLSETAFVTPISDKKHFTHGSRFNLRWFTPTCEVALCGHATLATAHVLINILANASKRLEFYTKSGKLLAEKTEDGKIGIDLPSYPPRPLESEKFNISDLINATVGALPVQDLLLSPSRKLLIRLGDTVTREELEALQPNDRDLLAATKGISLLGVIVTLVGHRKTDCVSDSGEQYDFISRYFAPWLGISEDPVTGSAHAVLAPYWSDKLEKKKLFARQCSKRGGELHIEMLDGFVRISGDTVTTLQGKVVLS